MITDSHTISHSTVLQTAIEPLRNSIIYHKVYGAITSIEELRIFMQYHVYAVWDFMSLLKSLQNALTCTSVPWFPKGNAAIRHLINEIVLGEESDIDMNGQRISHFELYLDAMKQCGADTASIETFISELQQHGDFQCAFQQASTPAQAQDFVLSTFDFIHSGKDYIQSAVFTFGREDLIPSMFIRFINELYGALPQAVSIFKYYIERHIEVDGDHHSNLALQMTESLCNNDEQLWQEATEAVYRALYQRLQLWNAAYNDIMEHKSVKKEAEVPKLQ